MLSERNTEGMEILYDNFASVLYGVILKIVREENSADELLQETLLKIKKDSIQFDPVKYNLYAWIINICRNLIIDKLRSKDFTDQNKNLTRPLSVNIAESNSSFDPELVDAREKVRKLEPEFRQIIDLLYFQGLTQSEAAEKLNIPLGTVKTRSRAALQRLSDHFDSMK